MTNAVQPPKDGCISYLLFIFGLLSSDNWLQYYRYYIKEGADPLRNVSAWKRSLLLQIPFIAVPTVAYLIFDGLLYGLLVWLALHLYISTFQAVILISIVMFMSFTPGHDAAHESVSTNSFINGIIGRISFQIMGPIAVFIGWKTLHLRHHKFTNDPDKDPDRYACNGPVFLLPFRWLTTIYQYVWHWLNLADEPGIISLRDKIEAIMNLTLNALICVLCYDFGYFYEIYFYWMLPSTFCHAMLVFAFDFLPHFQHSITPTENRYKTTSNIETYSIFEPLLTIILHYQNYHLLHHLYPTVPFYRYKAKWEEKKIDLKQRNYPVLLFKFNATAEKQKAH